MTLVFTNGCFELVHPGHVDLLARARALGDRLVVGLNSDRSVRAIKGPERPVVSEDARAAVLRALRSVDEVLVPSARTSRVQEAHLAIAHIWCEVIDLALGEGGR